MRHRVYSLYGELKWIARELHETLDTERRRGLMRQPDDLEERVFRMRMPKAYTGLGYTFRLNIQRLRASRVKEPPAGAAQVVQMPETWRFGMDARRISNEDPAARSDTAAMGS